MTDLARNLWFVVQTSPAHFVWGVGSAVGLYFSLKYLVKGRI